MNRVFAAAEKNIKNAAGDKMNIDYIRYKHGMIMRLSQRDNLKSVEFKGEAIPEEVRRLIEKNDLFSLQGTIGMEEGAAPIEYEELEIKAGDRMTEIQIFNKGMSMFLQETPELKRIFEVCCRLQRISVGTVESLSNRKVTFANRKLPRKGRGKT
jgi:hypothetical protein